MLIELEGNRVLKGEVQVRVEDPRNDPPLLEVRLPVELDGSGALVPVLRPSDVDRASVVLKTGREM